MIQSKPKFSTLLSLWLFLVLAYGAGLWTWLTIPASPLYWYLIPMVILTIAAAVTLKVIRGYQTIEIKGEQWKISRLVGATKMFNSRDIQWWKETEIKTAGGPYKQLHIHVFDDIMVKVSLQEHTNYLNIARKVKNKHPKKQIKDS